MQRIDTTKVLRLEYHEEPGTGLGPTLEFYSLLAENLKTIEFPIGQGGKMVTMWRDDVPDHQLFPRAIDLATVDREILIEVCRLFQMTGIFMAKSIVDNRLIDMPMSPLMWDLIFGKEVNLFSLKPLGDIYKLFQEL